QPRPRRRSAGVLCPPAHPRRALPAIGPRARLRNLPRIPRRLVPRRTHPRLSSRLARILGPRRQLPPAPRRDGPHGHRPPTRARHALDAPARLRPPPTRRLVLHRARRRHRQQQPPLHVGPHPGVSPDHRTRPPARRHRHRRPPQPTRNHAPRRRLVRGRHQPGLRPLQRLRLSLLRPALVPPARSPRHRPRRPLARLGPRLSQRLPTLLRHHRRTPRLRPLHHLPLQRRRPLRSRRRPGLHRHRPRRPPPPLHPQPRLLPLQTHSQFPRLPRPRLHRRLPCHHRGLLLRRLALLVRQGLHPAPPPARTPLL